MKLAVSNIAWEPLETEAHPDLLSELGCEGVELAPSVLWPEPTDAPSSEVSLWRKRIEERGLAVTGFHALLYTRPDLQLLGEEVSRRSVVSYLSDLARLCADMGGRILVFGSPRNRVRHGRSEDECFRLAAEVFHSAADACRGHGVTLCIEPLAPDESDFITSAAEGLKLVRLTDHDHFRLHLDAKAMLGAKEDADEAVSSAKDVLRHVHVGDPGLAPPGSTGADHAAIGRALRTSGYKGFVSVEMRRGHGPSKDVVRNAVGYVRRHYLGEEIAP